MLIHISRPKEVIAKVFAGDGLVPNSRLPAVIYPHAVNFCNLKVAEARRELAGLIEERGWEYMWTDNVYKSVHFHPNVFECLVVYSGEAELKLGGARIGQSFYVEVGSAVFIPPGVGHQRVHSTRNFKVFGLYPMGPHYVIWWGKEAEYKKAQRRARRVPLPEQDPLFGKEGPLLQYWK